MTVSSPKLDVKFLKGKNQVPNVFNIIHRMHEVVLSREKKKCSLWNSMHLGFEDTGYINE